MMISVAQVGARMHYAVPTILNEAKQLSRLYTDICVNKGLLRTLKLMPKTLLPGRLKRLVGRDPKGVDSKNIVSFASFALDFHMRQRRSNTQEQFMATRVWAGQTFCELILKYGLPDDSAIYGFNNFALELLKSAEGQNRPAIVEQTIAPMEVALKLIEKEHDTYPDWENDVTISPDLVKRYCQREAEEWTHASAIFCGSEFVKDGITMVGGPTEKCVVVPYGVMASEFDSSPRNRNAQNPSRKLRVLTVGNAGLRKGTPYVLEVAKRLREIADFRLVGQLAINKGKLGELQDYVEVMGSVPRSEVASHYEWADVFFLPSVCEGSATVTYEAATRGIPVICTPNTGSLVKDGHDGLIVPCGDIDRMCAVVEELATQPGYVETLSLNALKRQHMYSISGYRDRLLTAVNQATPELL